MRITGAAAVVCDGDDPHWFDPVARLGRRGWKYLSPATRYLLAAARTAVADGGPGPHPDRVGVVAGGHDVMTATHARMDAALVAGGVAGVSPVEVPWFSANNPASHLCVDLPARAFCVTMTNPVTAGLDAVLFARTAIDAGRADRVIVAAVEDAVPGAVLPGAVALVLDDGPAGPSITGGVSAFAPPGNHSLTTAAARRVAALAEDGARLVVCAAPGAEPITRVIRDVLAGTVKPGGDHGPRHGTVSALRHLCGALEEPGPALVVAVSARGHVTAISGTSVSGGMFVKLTGS